MANDQLNVETVIQVMREKLNQLEFDNLIQQAQIKQLIQENESLKSEATAEKKDTPVETGEVITNEEPTMAEVVS